MRGNGWQVFGVIAVLYILVSVFSFIIEGAADSAGTGVGIVVRVIVGVLTAPLVALASSVMYFELRGRSREDALEPEPNPAGPFQAGGYPPAAQ